MRHPILLYITGIGFFCLMDAVMKHLIESHSAILITFARFAAGIPFCLIVWQQAGRPAIGAEILPVHALRGGMIAAAALAFFWSLTRLTLAEAITFSFIAPLLVPPLASLFLKERMQGSSLVAALLGFCGVLVAVGVQPDTLSRARLEGVVVVLLGALFYAGSIILMRARAARDGPAILSLLGAAIPALLLMPFIGLAPESDRPLSTGDFGWILLAGFLGTLALQFLARAYALAEAQTLAPFEYTALGWGALLGWLFFAEPISLRTVAGAAIIIGACLWQARRSPVPAPATPAA